jgi:transcriptional regulator with XRE-family HTH domain
MDVVRFGLGVRALRRRRGMTQRQVAMRGGCSRTVIWRIERGNADRVAVHTLAEVAGALGARIDLRLLWHGEGLDRLLDARHARLVEIVLALLDSNGWDTATEVSFNIRGERGSIDVLAYHPPTRCVLVVEVKSVVPDIQAMLHGLDRKGRLAPAIAAGRSWAVASVTKMLVLPEDRTARRRIQTHAATIRAALPARTVAVRAWIRAPVAPGPGHGVLFLSDAPQASRSQRIRASNVRV